MKKHFRFFATAFLVIAIASIGVPAIALTWTRVNTVTDGMIGLYHFTNPNTEPFQVLEAADGLPGNVDLIVQEPTEGTGVVASSDVPSALFAPFSLELNGVQRIQTLDAQSNPAVSGSHSAEIWFKWDELTASSSFTFGFGGGASALVTRDTNNPANDQFGVRSGHGDYLPLQGFTNWSTWSVSVPLGEWHHVAYAIESPGSVPGEGDHNIYLPGSVMRLWINNVLVGTVDISGEENHQAARPNIRTFGGSKLYVDEFVLWDHDVSNSGTNVAPFADGRGNPASVKDWQFFD